MADFNGYAQSKLVSELFVRDIGRLSQTPDSSPSSTTTTSRVFSVIKPGYIIGTATEGIANPDDFLWRLSAGVLEVNGYNSADQDSYLFVSSADIVAEAIVRDCLACPSGNTIPEKTEILDGVHMQEFWDLLRRYNGGIKATQEEEWLRRVKEKTMERGKEHPLYPCLHIIEKGKGKLGGVGLSIEEGVSVGGERVRGAIVKNMEFLASIGFFPVLSDAAAVRSL